MVGFIVLCWSLSVSANKFNITVQNLGNGVHDLNSDSLYDVLFNTSPNAADTVYNSTLSPPELTSTSNAQEIAGGNGYTQGGTKIGSTAYSQTGGLATLTGSNVVFTATGNVGPLRYVVCIDETAGTSSTRPPLLWWDYGSSITLLNGETLTVNHSAGILTLQ